MNWTAWKPMPAPELARELEGPEGPGVYQMRHKHSGERIQFGISITCRRRMNSLFPKPYGTGTRNNSDKRDFILANWPVLEYRTYSCKTRDEAKRIEDELKSQHNHRFNT